MVIMMVMMANAMMMPEISSLHLSTYLSLSHYICSQLYVLSSTMLAYLMRAAVLISARWPNFLCVCSVFSSGSVQLHWSQWPPSQNGATPKWFCTSKGLLGCGPSGIMAGDAIITDSGAMHVAGVPIVNPSTIVVWEVTPGPGNGFQVTPKASTTCGVPPLSPPNWAGFAPLAAYLFSWQEYLLSEAKQGKKTDQNLGDAVPLYCSPVSNFSAYVSPEAAAQSAATTTWGSGVTAVAFDPTRGGSVIAVVIVEGMKLILITVFCRSNKFTNGFVLSCAYIDYEFIPSSSIMC